MICFWHKICFLLDVRLPSFEDVDCPTDFPKANLCILAHLKLGLSEMIVMTKTTDTIYEGYLGDIKNQIPVVMIDEPEDNSRLVSLVTILERGRHFHWISFCYRGFIYQVLLFTILYIRSTSITMQFHTVWNLTLICKPM